MPKKNQIKSLTEDLGYLKASVWALYKLDKQVVPATAKKEIRESKIEDVLLNFSARDLKNWLKVNERCRISNYAQYLEWITGLLEGIKNKSLHITLGNITPAQRKILKQCAAF